MLGEKSFRPLRKAPWTFSTQNPTRARVAFSAQFRDGAQGSSAPDARRPSGPGARPPAGQHGARGDTKASARGKRKSPKRFSLLTSVLIGGTEVFRTRLHASRQQFPSLFDAHPSSIPAPLRWMKRCASQPQNQSPCPRASSRSVLTGRRPCNPPTPRRRKMRFHRVIILLESLRPVNTERAEKRRYGGFQNEIAHISATIPAPLHDPPRRREMRFHCVIISKAIILKMPRLRIRQGKTGRNGREEMRFHCVIILIEAVSCLKAVAARGATATGSAIAALLAA